jgi:hypothetical protein
MPATTAGSLIPGLPTTHFDQALDSRLSPDALWSVIERAFADSAKEPLWPGDSVSLRALEPLAQGAVIEARYHLGPASRTVRYALLEWHPDQRRLRYWTEPDHPLWGGGEIRALASGLGSQLTWRGSYQARDLPSRMVLVWLKLHFLGRFFKLLQTKLQLDR